MTLITAQWSLIKTLPTPAPHPPAPAIGPPCARRSTLTGRGPVSINCPHRPCSAQQPARLSHWKTGSVNHGERPFPQGATPPTGGNGRDRRLTLAATTVTHPHGPPHCWASHTSDWPAAATGGVNSGKPALPLATTAVRLARPPRPATLPHPPPPHPLLKFVREGDRQRETPAAAAGASPAGRAGALHTLIDGLKH